jgi:hypothetical protein
MQSLFVLSSITIQFDLFAKDKAACSNIAGSGFDFGNLLLTLCENNDEVRLKNTLNCNLWKLMGAKINCIPFFMQINY